MVGRRSGARGIDEIHDNDHQNAVLDGEAQTKNDTFRGFLDCNSRGMFVDDVEGRAWRPIDQSVVIRWLNVPDPILDPGQRAGRTRRPPDTPASTTALASIKEGLFTLASSTGSNR